MENYYVYCHTFPNGKKYIGITCKNPSIRWGRNGIGYKTQFVYRAIQKYNWNNIKHEILFNNLTREEAELKEIELIAFYKSDHIEYGYNVESGGKNPNGRSNITKNKISNSNKGKIFTKLHRENLSKSHKGIKPWNTGLKGNKLPNSTISNMRKNNPKNILINQYDLSMNLLNTFSSSREAERMLNIDHKTILRSCNFKTKNCKGYIFRYVNK